MQLRFGELPEDHIFLVFIRPLTDWAFKFITWLGIAATFGVAAQRTGSPYLWTIYLLTSFLAYLFIYNFLHWLSSLKRDRKSASFPPAEGRVIRWAFKARIFLIGSISFVIFWVLVVVSQIAVDQAISAIAEFQKSAR